MLEDRSGLIRVTNNTDLPKPIKGRYDGIDYEFKKGVPVDIPEIAAMHIFDFGKDDKSQALTRLGWMFNSDQLERAMEILAQVEFDDPPELVEVPKAPKGKGRKTQETGTAGPPVNAGGTKGGDFNSPPNGPKIGEGAEAVF